MVKNIRWYRFDEWIREGKVGPKISTVARALEKAVKELKA